MGVDSETRLEMGMREAGPLRLCGPAPAHAWTTPEEYFRNLFFQVVDTAVTQLKLRYDQPGLHSYMQLENILIAADTKTDELKTVISAYPEVDADGLAIQLARCDNRTGKWSRWMTSLQSSHQLNQLIVHSMFDQVEQLVRLLLTIPCSSAEAERSFSSLRCLKTHMRNSMSQQQLSHLAVLHVHRDRLHVYSIDIDVTAREFVAKSENRLATFGRI